MRWAFTGVCTSETVQTQKDKRCDRTLLGTQEGVSGLREGPGGVLRGTEFPSQVKVLWGQQGTCT